VNLERFTHPVALWSRNEIYVATAVAREGRKSIPKVAVFDKNSKELLSTYALTDLPGDVQSIHLFPHLHGALLYVTVENSDLVYTYLAMSHSIVPQGRIAVVNRSGPIQVLDVDTFIKGDRLHIDIEGYSGCDLKFAPKPGLASSTKFTVYVAPEETGDGKCLLYSVSISCDTSCVLMNRFGIHRPVEVNTSLTASSAIHDGRTAVYFSPPDAEGIRAKSGYKILTAAPVKSRPTDKEVNTAMCVVTASEEYGRTEIIVLDPIRKKVHGYKGLEGVATGARLTATALALTVDGKIKVFTTDELFGGSE